MFIFVLLLHRHLLIVARIFGSTTSHCQLPAMPISHAGGSVHQSTSFSPDTVQAIGYASLAVVSVVVLVRIALQYARPRKITAEDYWMAFAYVLFVALCILYIILSPMQERVRQYTNGDIGPYSRFKEDAYLIRRLIFPALLFFWTIL